MASKSILILGNHPIAEEIARRHERLDSIVKRNRVLIIDGSTISHYDELYLLGENCDKNKTIAALLELAEENILDNHSGNKLLCHLLIHDRKTLQMLKTCDPYGAVRRKLDVYPFSIEEIWSQSFALDYEPITIHSDKHVHLVIFGMDEVAETVAIHAAHVAHYPNYVRNHSLRTRITLISENAETQSEEFIKRYRHLFDNSYYRIVKPSEEQAVRAFHKPMYDGRREDFVDVEWEFVDAESWHPDVREKLKQWAQDDKQLLTVVMADKIVDKNVAMSLFLPDELYLRSIPIHKYNPNAVEYDVTMPLVQMAKIVNYIYDRCYNDNFKNWQGEIFSSVEINAVDRDRLWVDLSNVKRWSSIYNEDAIYRTE